MSTPAEIFGNPEVTGELKLVHSSPVSEELAEYTASLCKHIETRGLNGINAGDPFVQLTTATCAGTIFDDYAVPSNFKRAYVKADELIQARASDDEFLERIETIYEKLGGYQDDLGKQHPLVYVLDQLRAQTSMGQDVFINVRRRALVLADAYFDIVD